MGRAISAIVSHFIFFSVIALAAEPEWGSLAEKKPHVAQKLKGVLDGLANRPEVVNCVACVQLGQSGLSWTGTCGPANPVTGEKMTPDHQFRIASVTKTFTAVAILQLIEEGCFDLDSKLVDVLPTEAIPEGRSVAGLHILGGTERGQQLTLRHLLSHTSGLPDYFTDAAPDGDFPGMTFGNAMRQDVLTPGTNGLLKKMWVPREILAFYYRSDLPTRPKFLPGKGFHYADTNFVLLGLTIEAQTRKPLAVNYRSRILEKAEMPATYFLYREAARGKGLAHQFDLDGKKNYDITELGLNTSADWAGGGLVSTVHDLSCFIRALFAGKLFRRAETLDAMLAGRRFTDELEDGRTEKHFYGLGLERWKTKRDHEYWGHQGYWGVAICYFPLSDVSIVLSRNQPHGPEPAEDAALLADVLDEAGLLGPR